MATPANKVTKTLYNGEVEIHFYPDSHRYKLAGEKTYLISVTGATGIIDKSRALIIWATRLTRDYLVGKIERGEKITLADVQAACTQHEEAKEKALNAGTLVHDFAEAFALAKIEGKPLPEIDGSWPEQVVTGVANFLEMIERHDVVFISAERLVHSRVHNFVGHADLVCLFDGKMSVLDWKTSSGLYPEYQYQVAGYDIALSEEDGTVFDQHVLVRFDKETGNFSEDTDLQVISGEDIRLNKRTFLSCLTVKERQKQLSKWGD